MNNKTKLVEYTHYFYSSSKGGEKINNRVYVSKNVKKSFSKIKEDIGNRIYTDDLTFSQRNISDNTVMSIMIDATNGCLDSINFSKYYKPR